MSLRTGVVVSRREGNRLVVAQIDGKYWLYYTAWDCPQMIPFGPKWLDVMTRDATPLNSAQPNQVSNWTDTNSTWDTPGNWSQQGVSGTVAYNGNKVQLTVASGSIAPIPTTLATIAPPNSAAVTGPAAPATVASLTIGDSSANSHSLTLQSGGSVTVNGPLTVHPTGILNASAAAFSATTLNMNGGSVTLGAGASAGTVNLTSGTLAATTGNELTVSTKLVKGAVNVTAGATPSRSAAATWSATSASSSSRAVPRRLRI